MKKLCPACQREKDSEGDFSKDRTRPDGRAAYCKKCYALQVRSMRAKANGFGMDKVQRVIEASGGMCSCCGLRPVSLDRKVDYRDRSFIDFRIGWGFPAGVLCSDCAPHVHTVKNSRTRVEYLRGTTLEMT